jgi:hypothetical protein
MPVHHRQLLFSSKTAVDIVINTTTGNACIIGRNAAQTDNIDDLYRWNHEDGLVLLGTGTNAKFTNPNCAGHRAKYLRNTHIVSVSTTRPAGGFLPITRFQFNNPNSSDNFQGVLPPGTVSDSSFFTYGNFMGGGAFQRVSPVLAANGLVAPSWANFVVSHANTTATTTKNAFSVWDSKGIVLYGPASANSPETQVYAWYYRTNPTPPPVTPGSTNVATASLLNGHIPGDRLLDPEASSTMFDLAGIAGDHNAVYLLKKGNGSPANASLLNRYLYNASNGKFEKMSDLTLKTTTGTNIVSTSSALGALVTHPNSNKLYFLDPDTKRIYVYNNRYQSGTSNVNANSQFDISTTTNNPTGLAISRKTGDFFVLDATQTVVGSTVTQTVYRYSPAGVLKESIALNVSDSVIDDITSDVDPDYLDARLSLADDTNLKLTLNEEQGLIALHSEANNRSYVFKVGKAL